MGAIISPAQLGKIKGYIEVGRNEADLVYGGTTPAEVELRGGNYINPTVFADVDMSKRIAREEIFGPVISVIKWSDEDKMFCDVNLRNAHHASRQVESGYVWVNDAGPHILGAPFGGYKMSGIGREEAFSELYSFTQTKNVNITL
jgi:betaine-aldehyde dehydrogenase